MALGMSDLIAGFINGLLADEQGSAELQRADLANRFNCVPSQINYVIATRFSPERGYIVESRRGGGGYIRITRVRSEPKRLLMHTVNAIGDSVDAATAAALISNLMQSGSIDRQTARLILAAVNDTALRAVAPEGRGEVRAAILKQILINVLNVI